ncbi:hypothetical protein CNECB9_3480021 [Cupriavidus necator]|uniref:Acyl-CoA dehydrogenase/oxidase N-terminal domain-containing protein n=1 Tax=Cupriavidus necator TaxID=106590 RepID=A0A1K0JCK2_CUPNE|nr:hypothetical protein CNECB9_3480021 [Cupriavidus necator]
MNFELSEEHQAFAESVRRFAQDKLAPGALARAHSAQYPWDAAQMLAEQGLLGIAFPEEDGGQGGTLMHAVIAIQEVAFGVPQERGYRAGGQFRTYPHLCGICHGGAEGPLPARPAGGQEAHCARHDRTGSRLGRHGTEDLGAARRRPLCD